MTSPLPRQSESAVRKYRRQERASRLPRPSPEYRVQCPTRPLSRSVRLVAELERPGAVTCE